MQLSQPFIRLPLTVDADRLRAEIRQFGSDDWRPHPQGHPGNSALPLVARHGQAEDDGVAGPMAATPHLARCPYVNQVLAALRVPLGRTRLMRLAAGAEATSHIDTNYYWAQRVRVHIPILTSPEVRFLCGDAETHMAPGEIWIFDTWRPHNVLNVSGAERIHLVADTVGSSAFWAMTRDAESIPSAVPFAPDTSPALMLESINFPIVMSPYEFTTIWTGWRNDAATAGNDAGAVAAVDAEVQQVQLDWRANWAVHGEAPPGWPAFAELLRTLQGIAGRYAGAIKLANRQDLARLIQISLVPSLHSPDLARSGAAPGDVPDLGQEPTPPAASASASASAMMAAPRHSTTSGIARPLIILCAPRSGSTLLFERLRACSPDWCTVGNESHPQFEGIAALKPERRGYDSNVLTAADATNAVATELRSRFLSALRDRNGMPVPQGGGNLRLLEKTPKNALRVPFLRAVFPDARFLYLWREPEESLASLIEGWQSEMFVTYPDLPDWPGPRWSYLLVPGWRELAGRPLHEIVTAQWRTTQERLLQDMAAISPDAIRALSYADFLAEPEASLRAVCAFAGVTFDRVPPAELPLSLHTVSPPAPDKWRRREDELAPLLPALLPLADRARQFVAAHTLSAAPVEKDAHASAEAAAPRATAVPSPAGSGLAPENSALAFEGPQFSSIHTNNFPEILRQLNISLLVTNYQGGNLIAVRADGPTINTHFAHFAKPMGLAVNRERLLIGTETGIREFRNIPSVSGRLVPPNRHDAVYVYRKHHVTGDINIHEMAIGADNECWFVNTRFSCLCTLDADSSFRPRWRPSFITGLSPEDRCHLNGLAMVNGQPRWLTALGATDGARGWRVNTKDGGIVIDYATREVVVRGLSMPHSPRWYRNRFWFLESGRGSLATIDLATGKVDTVIRLPGFTRGLDFVGPLAFIGLSQLRETNPLTDIPITEENIDRMSGVWVVNIETGQTIAILKFGDAVQEIFAVQAIPGIQYPEIIDENEELLQTVFALPDESFKEIHFNEPAKVT
jgi:uncharacterized protein (TIGR03032 family)